MFQELSVGNCNITSEALSLFWEQTGIESKNFQNLKLASYHELKLLLSLWFMDIYYLQNIVSFRIVGPILLH